MNGLTKENSDLSWDFNLDLHLDPCRDWLYLENDLLSLVISLPSSHQDSKSVPGLFNSRL